MTSGFATYRWAALGLVASLIMGCRKDTPPPEKKEEAVATAPDPKPRKAARAVDEGVDVPTEEDFEEAVEKQITAETNLQKELDLIEKQIQQQ
jgi:hypothetical protein